MRISDQGKHTAKLKILLIVIAVFSVISTGLNVYQYESYRASINVEPSNQTQSLNPFPANTSVNAGDAFGSPLDLTWPGLLTGNIVSNSTIYFFITFEYNNVVQIGASNSYLYNSSTYIAGPQKVINVSVELPPGKWSLNLYAPNSDAKVEAYNFKVTYTFYTPTT